MDATMIADNDKLQAQIIHPGGGVMIFVRLNFSFM